MKYPQLILGFFGLCACASFSILRAQQEETVLLPTFTVESNTVDRYRAADAISAVRIRTQLIETPHSINVLTRDLMNDVMPARVDEVTRYIPGVQATTGETLYMDLAMIRGFRAIGRTVDNFRDVATSNIDEALIERVELTKGPNSLLAPDSNPGGSINIVTKSPLFKPHASFTALVGEFDAQKGTLDFGDTIGGVDRFSYRVVGTYQDSRREFDSHSKIRTRLINPQLAWRINERTDLVIKYHYYDSVAARFPYYIMDPEISERGQKPRLAPGFQRTSNARNGSPSWNALTFAVKDLTAQFSTSINDHITVRLAGHWQYFSENTAQSFLRAPGIGDRYNPYTGKATLNQTWALADTTLPYHEITNPYVPTDSPYYDRNNISHRGERTVGDFIEEYAAQNDWVFNFDIPHAKLQTVTGWAYRESTSESHRLSGVMDNFDLDDPSTFSDAVTWSPGWISDTEAKVESFQIFLNQRVSLLDEKLAIAVGALHYSTKTSSIDHVSIAPMATLDANKEIYFGSLLYRVMPNVSAYYSYSTNTSPSSADFQVRWSDGKQHEFGIKTEFFNRRLAINAAYFEIEQSNVAVGNPLYNTPDGFDPTQPQFNFQSYKNHGAEVELSGAITKKLSALGGIAYLKMRDPFGRRAANVADWTASALLNYRFDSGALSGLSLNLGITYVGNRPGEKGADFGPLGVLQQHHNWMESTTLINAGASYVWTRYSLSISVDNIADNTDLRMNGNRTGFPTPSGRNIRLSGVVRF